MVKKSLSRHVYQVRLPIRHCFRFLMIVLNVFIGLFNLIPLLPFDGGHVAIATYERIREIGRTERYHADLTKMLPVAYGVVLFMVTIGVMALYADITNAFNAGTVNSVQLRVPDLVIGNETVAFESPTGIIAPRQATFGARWSF